ncbi:MoCo/4Fe-4S cofactor protein with predicted Tat translocation signal [Bradyrhizobium sp. USDA 3256]
MRRPATKPDHPRGPVLWSSLEELSGDPAFEAWVDAEYPVAATFGPTARRTFLKLMGASFALAGLAGCEKSPFVAALPYVEQPQGTDVGIPKYYATAVTLDGYAQPVIATTYSGRPTKLDGNPDHPATQGRSDVFMQAAVLELYDPDRAQAPNRRGEPVTWSDVQHHIGLLRQQWTQSQGEGVALLLGHSTSPTLIRQIEALVREFPKAQIYEHAAVGGGRGLDSTRAAYGQPLQLRPQFENCDVVVSLDDDFLGAGPHQVANARAWSAARHRTADQPGLALYMAEAVPSTTGAMAEARVAVDASRTWLVAQGLANSCDVAGAAKPDLSAKEQRWLDRAVHACRSARGRALVTCSRFGDDATASWVARTNEALGATALLGAAAPVPNVANAKRLSDLVSDIGRGAVQTLIIIDANPAYTAPAWLAFRDAVAKVRSSVHVGIHRDETGALCEWHLPLTHTLESWSDARSIDGTATIIQPTIAPFYDVRTVHQVMALLLGQLDPLPAAPVRDTWRAALGNDFETKWTRCLHDGYVPEQRAAPPNIHAAATAVVPPPPDDGLDIVFRPDPTIWDGSFANNAWLQELPKPLTTLTWGNVISIGPALAMRKDLTNGDHVRIRVRDRSISGPVWVLPGQAPNTVALTLGYGRSKAGRVGDGLGYNAYHVQPIDQPWQTKGSLHKLGTRETLAVTQLHHRMEGVDFVREVNAADTDHPKHETTQPSLYPPKPSAQNAWGMVIDLDACIGCNACVAACTAENNVPVVGSEQVKVGREMQWLRIARYYTGDVEEPRSFFQPVPCMHCEQAPCEMGCPVHATTHSPEGVNQMVYNRCIGTRTCSSYCPYKVRRFNFFDYRPASDAPEHAAHNPDVTVRSRGVMEKCTYCTQRIEAAHVAADKENRPIRDGEVVTACQSACPTKAIVFGDIRNPDSEVSRLRGDGRHYVLLEEQGTRPRTTYLARWKPPEGQG